MQLPAEIRPFHGVAEDPYELDAVARLQLEAVRERWPRLPLPPHIELTNQLSTPSVGVSTERWIAWDAEGVAIGLAELNYPLSSVDRRPAGGYLFVRPEVRRRGLGTALVTPLVAAARKASRDVLKGVTHDEDGTRFCEALGASYVLETVQLHLRPKDVPRRQLDRLGAPPHGYELVSWARRCPDRLLPSFARTYDTKNTWELAAKIPETRPMDPPRVRELEAEAANRQRVLLTVAGIDSGSGDVVGFTDVQISDFRPRVAYHGWTVVRPDHRGRGVAGWLKAEMTRQLLSERTEVEIIFTKNAIDNEPIRAINEALGFRPVQRGHQYHGDVARLGARLRR